MDKEEAKRILEKAAIRARDTNVPSNGEPLTLEELKECPASPENNREKCDENILEWLQQPAREG